MQVNPVGLSAARSAPELGTHFRREGRGTAILPHSGGLVRRELGRKSGDKWDSGWVRSDESVYIPYGGAPLRSRETCFWKVRVKTGKGCSAWSQPAAWTMGFMVASAWEARCRPRQVFRRGAHGRGIPAWAARYFRKEFDAPGEVRRAVLYISGLGALRSVHQREAYRHAGAGTGAYRLRQVGVLQRVRCYRNHLSGRKRARCGAGERALCLPAQSGDAPFRISEDVFAARAGICRRHVPQGRQRRFVACDGRRADPREQRIRR